jgi:hypothetical protein
MTLYEKVNNLPLPAFGYREDLKTILGEIANQLYITQKALIELKQAVLPMEDDKL